MTILSYQGKIRLFMFTFFLYSPNHKDVHAAGLEVGVGGGGVLSYYWLDQDATPIGTPIGSEQIWV